MGKRGSGNYLMVAAKDLECHICGGVIPKGMKYWQVDGKDRHTVCHNRKRREMCAAMSEDAFFAKLEEERYGWDRRYQ